MPKGAMDIQTFNEVYGRTNHPDNPDTHAAAAAAEAAAVNIGRRYRE